MVDMKNFSHFSVNWNTDNYRELEENSYKQEVIYVYKYLAMVHKLSSCQGHSGYHCELCKQQ